MTQRAALPVPLRTRIHLCLGEVLHLLYLLLVVVVVSNRRFLEGERDDRPLLWGWVGVAAVAMATVTRRVSSLLLLLLAAAVVVLAMGPMLAGCVMKTWRQCGGYDLAYSHHINTPVTVTPL